MTYKLNFLNKKNFNILLISLFSFITANLYFYIFKNYFNILNPLILTFVVIFFQNFILLFLNKSYTFTINSFLILLIIIFFGRFVEYLIYLFLEKRILINSQIIFLLTLIISNLIKIPSIIFFSNWKKIID